MHKELWNSRQIVAVLTIEDIEAALWEDEIQQLYKFLKKIEDLRKESGKCKSRMLILQENLNEP